MPRKAIVFFVTFLTAIQLLIGQGHTEIGTEYGNDGISTYAEMRHGPDGRLFLDPYFLPYLKETNEQVVLDAGCGAGPWAIFAAESGAIVYGIDIQVSMIEKARLAALEAKVDDRISFAVGDVGNLPYPDNFFDKAVSLNVGCNLPSLKSHIKELQRVIKRGGSVLITAPTSFGVVFTDGSLDEVYRATFAKRKGEWVLVLDEKDLSPGEEIWRKIPKMVVPNYYHSEQEYLSLFEAEGFFLKSIEHPKFLNEQDRLKYNNSHKHSLGVSYVSSSPFVIFVIEKVNK